VKVREGDLVVFFLGKGEIAVPVPKTKYFKKLHPEGLLAKLFENFESVKELVQARSVEIIKMAIRDKGEGKQSIKTSEIRTALTGKKEGERGWRKDLYLIKDEEWKNWWGIVSKRLKSDPWFDTLAKDIVTLREAPVSKVESLFCRFSIERDPKKKLDLCETMVTALEGNEEAPILNSLMELLMKYLVVARS